MCSPSAEHRAAVGATWTPHRSQHAASWMQQNSKSACFWPLASPSTQLAGCNTTAGLQWSEPLTSPSAHHSAGRPCTAGPAGSVHKVPYPVFSLCGNCQMPPIHARQGVNARQHSSFLAQAPGSVPHGLAAGASIRRCAARWKISLRPGRGCKVGFNCALFVCVGGGVCAWQLCMRRTAQWRRSPRPGRGCGVRECVTGTPHVRAQHQVTAAAAST